MSAPPATAGDSETLIDRLLAEQRLLTAAEKFSQLHNRQQPPLLEPHYRDLLPLSAPRPGEQYAFEVNLDKCSGCKGCVAACHSLNGLDEGEAWREVGALFGEAILPSTSGGNRVIPLQKTVTTACHHCVEPGCLLGCPVLAYDKDPLTGIVRHLDDQCIGCSYCILKCPYDVPKYSAKRGIVRKCDMCHDRLAAGEAPACVQACPHEAIRISVVKQREVTTKHRRPDGGHAGKWEKENRGRGDFPSAHSALFPSANSWLPDSPQADITLPTTRYVSAKPIADLRAADHFDPKPAPAHWPLVLMLVLTQAGMGGLSAAAFTEPAVGLPWIGFVSFALLSAGMLASLFHLGQPAKAWRVWLGWRTSWLSREAIALNVFAGAAATMRATHWLPVPEATKLMLAVALVVLAIVTLIAQTMVYADTRRHFWRASSTALRFIGTTVVLGLALHFSFRPIAATAVVLVLTSLVKLGFELNVLKQLDIDSERWTQLRRTAVLQTGALRPVFCARLLLALSGGVVIPIGLLPGTASGAWAIIAAMLCLASEFAERYLFFTSVSPDKMPGQP